MADKYDKMIYAVTREGRELEIILFAEPRCTAFEHSGNAYPMLQEEADRRGLQTEKRNLRYAILYVGMKETWLDVEEVYAKYMRDPIVWVFSDDCEYHWPPAGRPKDDPQPFYP